VNDTAIGPYVVEGELGRGAFGVVLRGREPNGRLGGRPVAIKLLAVGLPTDEDRRRRFAREVDALARLRHPGIVAFLGAGEHRGRPYLVTELVDGEGLDARLQRGPLPADEVARVGIELAAALAHAHACGVLHRDLKPANVLLGRDGRARLIDFGLTRDAEGLGSLTQSGLILGTPGYWAPEQAAGQPSAFGPHTDVWGLGATLYAALTREPPFRGATFAEVAYATVDLPVPPPSKVVPVPRALEAVVLRCLEKAPAKRWPDAVSVGVALEAALVASDGRGRAVQALVALALLSALAATAAVAFGRRPPVVVAPTPVTEPAPVASAAPPPSVDERTPSERLVEAMAAKADAGQVEDALAELTAALAKDPSLDSADARLLQGELRNGTGDVPGAIEALDASLRLEESARVRARRGELRLQRGDLAGGLEDLRRAVELEPKAALVWGELARVLVQSGDPAGALEAADRAVAEGPHLAAVWGRRASIRYARGEAELALADANEALELEADDVEARLVRGALLQLRGELKGALRDFQRVIELSPERHEGWLDRGLVRGAEGDLQGALADFDQAARLAPDDVEVLRNRGRLRRHLNLSQGALDDLSRALERAPDDAQLRLERAATNEARGAWREVLDDVDAALRLRPGDPEVFGLRASAKDRLGDRAGALADYDQALALGKDDPFVHANRANILRDLGRHAESAASWSRALERRPDWIDGLAGRIDARLASNDLAGAEADLDALGRLAPQEIGVFLKRGRLRAQRGDVVGARADLTIAVQRYPDGHPSKKAAQDALDALPR
jgi:tetratricopeptide (TPR) repeat protein